MDLIKLLLTQAIGLVMVGGILAFIYRRHAESWQSLQPFYGQDWRGAAATRHMQNLMLYSKGDFARHYAGIVTIGVFPNGIGIRFMPILGIFHDPIFVPFKDIEGWQQKWYINAKSIELCFKKRPDLRIIMPASQVAWIAEQGFANISINPERPPTGNWPYVSFISAMILLALAIAVCITVYVKADGNWVEIWSLLGPGERGHR